MVLVLVTHADPLQYCPEGQSVLEVVLQYPVPPPDGTNQYWPEGQDVVVPVLEHPDAGVEEHEYKVPFTVRYSVIAELKHRPLAESIVCQPVPYLEAQSVAVVLVEVVQDPAPPPDGTNQYWPEGQDVVVPVPVPERCWQMALV